jgi:hypothetical protein
VIFDGVARDSATGTTYLQHNAFEQEPFESGERYDQGNFSRKLFISRITSASFERYT